MSEDINSISHTREQLARHHQLPLWRRIGERARGAYPSRQDRERLRRHEIGPVGRIQEDAHAAVGYSKKLNRTPSAVLVQPWSTGPTTGDNFASSIPLELSPGSAGLVGVQQVFLDNEYQETTTEKTDTVGVFVNKDLGWHSPVGIYAMHGNKLLGTVELSKADISSLDPATQDALGSVVGSVASLAFHTYQQNRPENVG